MSAVAQPNIRDLDGKLFMMTPHPDAGCCAQNMFNMYSCCTPVVMEQKSIDDTTVAGTNVTLCWGMFPFSPLPCFLCCGVGPLKPEFRFKQDEKEPTKWVGVDSVFPNCCACCRAMTTHEGDTFIFDAKHIGSQTMPMEMVAGKNKMNPPCFWGVKMAEFKEVSNRSGKVPLRAAGAPEGATMTR